MSPDGRISRPPALSELRFLFQPVQPLSGGRAWAEALVRWYLPDGTVRGPLDVLPHWLAPSNVASFTRYTLDQAAYALAGVPTSQVSVNLSPVQVMLPDTMRILDDLVPAVRGRLRIEITEQRLRDRRPIAASLPSLRSRCAAIMLDDVTPDDLPSWTDLETLFGSGLDGVKIDRSVTWQLFGADTAARELAREFVMSARRRFDIVVAEGVEDPSICHALVDLGVTHVQGFGVGRPRRALDGTTLDRRVAFHAPAPPPAPAPVDAQTPGPVEGNACDGP